MSRSRPTRPDLGELLGESAALLRPSGAGQTLRVAELRPGLSQPRRSFDEAGLAALAQSIRSEGVLQPLLVRAVPGGHEIVAGERRWRAAQLAGLDEVPVIVRTLTDQQARVAALLENLQRENLNLIDEVDGKLDLAAAALGLGREEARARLVRLTKEPPGDEAAALDALFAPLGETWSSFAKNKLRVLAWPPAVVGALRSGLRLTLASVIVGAPEEHHAALIALAGGGASRSELQAEVLRLGQRPETSAAGDVARKLSSRRFLASLGADDRRAVDRWLARMPEVLKN
ncbi:ParB/RepB/Spo0J family partition protein [Deinococcus sp. Leaf326]|uniref:ParB/RepB/Spo0J family partition protein n=1 Tax=Deinococcus sp. Leaf326 TaxID=1736338 RepID=UPI0006FD9069|nr:ParB/RepB/Spo0J family partition protein [Deinococcus sp. Leaf326]KQR35639.1 chromosome partitioning protein ParB [Deinococcus sp. Leaf326]